MPQDGAAAGSTQLRAPALAAPRLPLADSTGGAPSGPYLGQPSAPAFPLKLSPVLHLLICPAARALLISHAAHHYFLLLFFPISGNDKYVF